MSEKLCTFAAIFNKIVIMKKVFWVIACLVIVALAGCEKKMTSDDIANIDVTKLDSVEVACWEYSISWIQNKTTHSYTGRVWGTEREAVEELQAALTIYKRSGEISEAKYSKTGAKDEESCDPTGKK